MRIGFSRSDGRPRAGNPPLRHRPRLSRAGLCSRRHGWRTEGGKSGGARREAGVALRLRRTCSQGRNGAAAGSTGTPVNCGSGMRLGDRVWPMRYSSSAYLRWRSPVGRRVARDRRGRPPWVAHASSGQERGSASSPGSAGFRKWDRAGRAATTARDRG